MKTKFKAKPVKITRLAESNKLFVWTNDRVAYIWKGGCFVSGCFLVRSVTTLRVNRKRTYTLNIAVYGKVILTPHQWDSLWFGYKD